MPVIECDPTNARKKLQAAGATIKAGNTESEQWRAEYKDASAIAYAGKVVVQGKNPHIIKAILEDHQGRVHLYFDGASRGNPGPSAIGWLLVSPAGVVAENGTRVGTMTNNQAEYEALIRGLQAAADYGFSSVEIRGDSELIVKQVRGEWDTNDPVLREYRINAHELLSGFDTWSITHVPREINDRADDLANEALNG